MQDIGHVGPCSRPKTGSHQRPIEMYSNQVHCRSRYWYCGRLRYCIGWLVLLLPRPVSRTCLLVKRSVYVFSMSRFQVYHFSKYRHWRPLGRCSQHYGLASNTANTDAQPTLPKQGRIKLLPDLLKDLNSHLWSHTPA